MNKGTEQKSGKRGISKLDSYALTIIALSAVVVSIWQAYQQRLHDRISVRPYLEWVKGENEEGFTYLKMKNKGFGPAFIQQGKIVVGDSTFRDWRRALQYADSGIDVARSSSMGIFTLLPGEEFLLTSARGGSQSIDIEFLVEFEDAYGTDFDDGIHYIGSPF